jgi:hypothetical protein
MTEQASSRLEELAAKCEQATGPDRELDHEIYAALHHPEYVFPAEVLNRKPRDLEEALDRMHWDGGGGSYYRRVPYCTSLDAAMTLVPEGEDWAVGSGPLFPTSARVAGKPAVQAATPALALCAAALRAHAKLKGEGNE